MGDGNRLPNYYSGCGLCLLFNPEDSERAFHLPAAHAYERWRLETDTAADAQAADRESPGEAGAWCLGSRSLRVLACMGELEA